MKRIFSALALLIMITQTSGMSVAMAEPDMDGAHEGRMLEGLDLTKEQREKLAEVRKSNKGSGAAGAKQVQEAQQKLKEAMKSDTSKEELLKLHEEVQKLRNQQADARFARILEVREVLTPEQRQKLADQMGQHQRGGMGRMHRKGMGRGNQ